jgi:hypothetical protein
MGTTAAIVKCPTRRTVPQSTIGGIVDVEPAETTLSSGVGYSGRRISKVAAVARFHCVTSIVKAPEHPVMGEFPDPERCKGTQLTTARIATP